jgi:hypothetical protein
MAKVRLLATELRWQTSFDQMSDVKNIVRAAIERFELDESSEGVFDVEIFVDSASKTIRITYRDWQSR